MQEFLRYTETSAARKLACYGQKQPFRCASVAEKCFCRIAYRRPLRFCVYRYIYGFFQVRVFVEIYVTVSGSRFDNRNFGIFGDERDKPFSSAGYDEVDIPAKRQHIIDRHAVGVGNDENRFRIAARILCGAAYYRRQRLV